MTAVSAVARCTCTASKQVWFASACDRAATSSKVARDQVTLPKILMLCPAYQSSSAPTSAVVSSNLLPQEHLNCKAVHKHWGTALASLLAAPPTVADRSLLVGKVTFTGSQALVDISDVLFLSPARTLDGKAASRAGCAPEHRRVRTTWSILQKAGSCWWTI